MMKTVQLEALKMSYSDTGGSKPLLLLLHGWPQTSKCWARIIPKLSQDYRVVAPDLRGYGLTDKPRSGFDKKTMAKDIRQLVESLGSESVRIVGHDRGARVAHRFALDHEDLITHLSLLDIVPTLHTFRNGTLATAEGYWHWLFHMKDDLPELLISSHIDKYLRFFFERWTLQRERIETVIPDYVRAFSKPGALRAGFDDYRATHVDLEHDAVDFEDGNTVKIPIQLLWGDHGLVAGQDVVQAWKPFAPNAYGESVTDCGHFIPEEQPTYLIEMLKSHLQD